MQTHIMRLARRRHQTLALIGKTDQERPPPCAPAAGRERPIVVPAALAETPPLSIEAHDGQQDRIQGRAGTRPTPARLDRAAHAPDEPALPRPKRERPAGTARHGRQIQETPSAQGLAQRPRIELRAGRPV